MILQNRSTRRITPQHAAKRSHIQRTAGAEKMFPERRRYTHSPARITGSDAPLAPMPSTSMRFDPIIQST